VRESAVGVHVCVCVCGLLRSFKKVTHWLSLLLVILLVCGEVAGGRRRCSSVAS